MRTTIDRPVAHSLVEIIMALALSVVVLAALLLIRFGPVTPGLSGGDPKNEPEQIELKLRQMVIEIQEGTRLFYPQPAYYPLPHEEGKEPRTNPSSGLGFVNVKGETILFYLKPVGKSNLNTLYRVSLNEIRTSKKEGKHKKVKPFLERVEHFRVTVAHTEPGKEPSLVDLDLAVRVGDDDAKEETSLNYVTSLYLRNLERYVPDDLFPAGTPLYELE